MKSLSLARPHAIMMVGIPGSGKTFFAEQFSKMFAAPYIDANRIAQLSRDEDAARQIAGEFAEQIALTKQTFIYEGATDSRVSRTEFARWAKTHGYQPTIIWVQTDPRTAETRLTKSLNISRDDYAELAKQFSAPHASEKPVVISGRHTYASQARVVLNHLAKDRTTSAANNVPQRPSSVRSHGGRSVPIS